ncbi:MAG: S41 family peptidase [Bacillota bacterium]|uniref:S41 family peptidase n=1 Tax=Desulfurispora thermophila TaxID=265470 RepID=UPI0012EA76ED|nr:S41 family peptidase [Desulfurispora thermophila]
MLKRFSSMVATVLLLLMLAVPARAAVEDASQASSLIEEIMTYVQKYHIDHPDWQQLTAGAIEGMLNAVGDPYTEYLSPEDLEKFTGSINGNYVGVGIRLQAAADYPRVQEVLPGTPAEAAQLQVDDRVIKVDGQDVKGMSLDQVVDLIRGQEGTTVTLTVRRGSVEKDYRLTRQPVSVPTVEGKSLGGGIAYVKVSSFGQGTAKELRKIILGLLAEENNKFILDLRNDPGGYLRAAVDIASLFLPAGKLVVTTEDSQQEKESYTTAGKPLLQNCSIIVLVNSSTASSAEVLAGALQDHGVAKLLGTSTYGKGVVQSVIPLDGGGALKLTTQRYFTPNGRSIHGRGLQPDISVETPQLQLPVAKAILAGGKYNLTLRAGQNVASLNGEQVKLGQMVPYKKDGHIYLPLRFVLEAAGYNVKWDQREQTITVQNGTTSFSFKPGQPTARIAGKDTRLPAPVVINSGSSWLPVEVLKQMGVNVRTDKDSVQIVR